MSVGHSYLSPNSTVLRQDAVCVYTYMYTYMYIYIYSNACLLETISSPPAPPIVIRTASAIHTYVDAYVYINMNIGIYNDVYL